MSIDAAAPDWFVRVSRWIVRLGDRSGPVPVLALAMAGMLVTQLGRTIHDVDIFWQLKLGEITTLHGLPAHEPFLAGRETEPLAVVAWLAQVVYACVRTLGGWTLLWLVDALVWFGGFVVVARHCARRMSNHWPVAVGLWVGWFAALSTASIRPQSFAALAFGLLIVLLRSNLSTARTAFLGAGLFVVWQNLHPSVAVGAIAVGAAVLGDGIQYLRKRTPAPPWRGLVLLPLAAIAIVCTPAGFDILRISRLNAELSLHLNVAEWLPMTWKVREYGRPFAWASLLVVTAGLALRGGRARASTLAVVLVFTAAMLSSHRFVLFWGIAVIPLACELFGTEPGPERPRSRFRRPIAALALALGIGGPCVVNPAPFADYYPFDGIRTLRDTGIRGTIYTTYYWGGMVAEAGYPDWRVTHDGRYYLHSAAEWDAYHRIANGGGDVRLDDLVARYKPVAFFLRPGSDATLIAVLDRDARWRTLFQDVNCIVFVPAPVR
jgi:hypothetical protein